MMHAVNGKHVAFCEKGTVGYITLSQRAHQRRDRMPTTLTDEQMKFLDQLRELQMEAREKLEEYFAIINSAAEREERSKP